jgi:hypothetical protein
MNWQTHPSGSTAEFTLDASGLVDPSTDNSPLSWYFGVAALTGELSKGITWNHCSFLHKGNSYA